MNKKELTHLVFIGRFSPIHKAHLAIMNEALTRADQLIICIGSANSPRTIKNPWTVKERMNMIYSAIPDADRSRVHFQFIEDRLYNNLEWATLVRGKIRSTVMEYFAGNYNTAKIGLVIAEKDDTSWYVNLFPEWKKEIININSIEDEQPIGATKIRELLFTGHKTYITHIVPENVNVFLNEFVKTDEYKALRDEYNDGMAYQKLYENHPKGHNINFYTTDAVVIQSGHILLVKRKYSPGKGLYALPGGHVGANEDAYTACLRELKEETGIKVQDKVLTGSLIGEKRFDHPDRSMRARITNKNARTVDVAFGFKLDDAAGLPKVTAGDDAEEAWFFTIDEVRNMRNELFEDHGDIIEYFLGKI